MTSSSQQHDPKVMQRIVRRCQRFDKAQQEHVASRYHEEYCSAGVEARAYFDARWSALTQEAQIEFASRTAQLESVARCPSFKRPSMKATHDPDESSKV
eukprot:3483368-Amphidinium_carterae.1